MNVQDLDEKLVAVLGYGQEGKSVTAYLLKHGITPVLFDQKPWTEWPSGEQEAIKLLGVNFIFGPDCFLELAGFDVAFRSPGIRISDIECSVPIYGRNKSPINRHATASIILTSQTKWFFDNCPAKIIGVTGTKGKGTTCALIYEMLKSQAAIGKNLSRTFLTGNIGEIQPLEILDNLDQGDWVVYELSSFQLEDLKKSPHISVVLMVTSEHLDYHENIKAYREAKLPIVKYQTAGDFSIINHDFPVSMSIGAFGKGKKLFFSRRKPVKPGCYVKDENIVIADSNFQFPTSNLQLKGRHNLENVCAAVLGASAAGCSPGAIKKAAIKFKGLEHRLEFVAEVFGVKYYNDSFSTTPETAIAAIEAFTEPETVILGGSSKNSDFFSLGQSLAGQKNIKALILIGREAKRIKSAVEEAGGFNGKILEGAASMAEIFAQIKLVAQKRDVVLLSPACASFGMFKNYKDRGEQFKQAVRALSKK